MRGLPEFNGELPVACRDVQRLVVRDAVRPPAFVELQGQHEQERADRRTLGEPKTPGCQSRAIRMGCDVWIVR